MSKSSLDMEKGGDVISDVKSVSGEHLHADEVGRDEVIVPQRWDQKLLSWGVETRGMQPVPLDERTDMAYMKQFYNWWSVNCNALPFSSGGVATFGFGMNLRDACLTILFFNILCCIPVAYVITWAPQTGMRQMVCTRYSFGYWITTMCVIFNLASMFGWGIINAIVGGQTLAAVSYGNMSWDVGVVIVCIVGLCISFVGLRALAAYEKFAWIPVFITFLIFVCSQGHHFKNQLPSTPSTSRQVLGYGGLIAGTQLTWISVAPDLAVYTSPKVSKMKLFWAAYIGLVVPEVLLMCLGAAVGSTDMESWQSGHKNGQLAGLMSAMFAPLGHFGKFLTCILALSLIANISLSVYSKSLNLQFLLPFLFKVPRYLMAIIVIAIMIPISVAGSHHIYSALENFLNIIGYWSATYAGIILIDHWVYKKNDFANYDISHWNDASKLPYGLAALLAFLCGWGIAIPSMDETWYAGPIATHAGDLGFELAFVCSALVYYLARKVELKFLKK